MTDARMKEIEARLEWAKQHQHMPQLYPDFYVQDIEELLEVVRKWSTRAIEEAQR